jgi:hypothetical protein
MPRSKKGRITGAARKEINQRRAQDAINGVTSDVAFARVTKILGANHVRAALASRRGPIEVHVRIPNIFARRGSTPITTRDVVTIYVGTDFDVDNDDFATAHFDITSILTSRQAYDLYKEGTVPKWMVHEEGSAVADGDDDGQFEFDYSDEKVDEETEGGATDKSNPRKSKRPAAPEDDDDINIDDI